MKRFVWVLIGFLAVASNADAFRYEIPLEELKGVYSTGDIAPRYGRQVFKLPAAFEQIDRIELEITGNVAPALWGPRDIASTDAPLPESAYEECYPILSFRLGGTIESGFQTTAQGAFLSIQEDGPFQLSQWMSADTWVPFVTLLHTDYWSMRFSLGLGYRGDFEEGEEVIPAIAAITDARLIIEGIPVPEPASALLILPGIFMLAWRRR